MGLTFHTHFRGSCIHPSSEGVAGSSAYGIREMTYCDHGIEFYGECSPWIGSQSHRRRSKC